MAKTDVLDILRAKKMDPLEFHFENLWIPPMYYYLTPQDIEELHKIATSVRLSSKIRQKYEMIDNIMRMRGFKRFSAGTNRVVYRCLEDNRFLVKIAVDKVGMQDNPLEYKNQFLLQPFVTKMFYVSPCGTVGFSERVLPIKNKAEFREIASDVFDILVNKILGLYVVEDVGTKYFMNWGIRMGFGPVLLDYPYVYKLDGNKLFCSWRNPDTGIICDGEIDYDAGFNNLVCARCGRRYLATNLRDDSIDNNLIIKKGGNQMRVILKKGDEIISQPIPIDEVMRPDHKPIKKNKNLVISINGHRIGDDTKEESTPIVKSTVECESKNDSDTDKVYPKSISSKFIRNDNTDNVNEQTSSDTDNIICSDKKNELIVESNSIQNEVKTSDIVKSDVDDEKDIAENDIDNTDSSIDDMGEDVESYDENNEEDEDDIILASDVELVRKQKLREKAQHQPRNDKGHFISTGDGSNKKNKNKKAKKSNFIPSNPN